MDEQPRKTRRINLAIREEDYQKLVQLAEESERILCDATRSALQAGLRQMTQNPTCPVSACPMESASKSESSATVSPDVSSSSPSESDDGTSKAEITISGAKDASPGPKPIMGIEIGISAKDEKPAGAPATPKDGEPAWTPGAILGKLTSRPRPFLDAKPSKPESKSEARSEQKVDPAPEKATPEKKGAV